MRALHKRVFSSETINSHSFNCDFILWKPYDVSHIQVCACAGAKCLSILPVLMSLNAFKPKLGNSVFNFLAYITFIRHTGTTITCFFDDVLSVCVVHIYSGSYERKKVSRLFFTTYVQLCLLKCYL